MDLIPLFPFSKESRNINNVLGYLDMTKLVVFDTFEETVGTNHRLLNLFCLLQENVFQQLPCNLGTPQMKAGQYGV